ncbi:MAG: hypothetical protein ABL986_20090 [Vicinamibacterales bacterium]
MTTTVSTLSPAATDAGRLPLNASSRALTTRFLDFWLIGGASIAVWLLLVVSEPIRTDWPGPIAQHFSNLYGLSLSLALFINYPHFMWSYKLAYSRGVDFVVAHWWQLIAVPLALIALLAAAYMWFDTPARDVGAIRLAARMLLPFGVNAQVVAGPLVGNVLLTLAFNLMVLTVGWHYTKQVFGCVMVYAHYDGYVLSPRQRATLKWTLRGVWLMAFVDNNRAGTFRGLAGFSYSSFDLPDALLPLAWIVIIGTLVLCGHTVVYANRRRYQRWPSANLVVPFAAIYIWWLPITRQSEFYLLLAPLFHSLQYLAFVYRFEEVSLRDAPKRELRATALMGSVVVAGWLGFEFLPVMADVRFETVGRWGFYFFIVAATLFINIHHYFIDSALWRFRDPVVRRNLLSA